MFHITRLNSFKCMTASTPDNLKHTTTISYNNEMCVAKGDTGASHHYWMKKDDKILKNLTKIDGLRVQLPNNELISATVQGELPLSKYLSPTAKRAMVLPKLKSSNLISIGQLCDDGCSIILNKSKLLAFKNNKIILKGTRNRNDGLWDIPIPKATITTSCCPSPTTHARVYNKRNTTAIPSTPTPPQHKNKTNSIPVH